MLQTEFYRIYTYYLKTVDVEDAIEREEYCARFDELSTKQKAISEFFDIYDLDELENFLYASEDSYKIDGGEYLLLTDDEANIMAKRYCLDLLNDELSSIPTYLRQYFDTDRYVEDVIRYDGRGSILSGYDGNESEAKIDGEYIYIYRTN